MTLIVMRGLPGSGKSTWARAWVALDPESRHIVSRDGFRSALKGHSTKKSSVERTITHLTEEAVKSLLRAEQSVVVDSTNLRHREVRRWLAVAEAEGHYWSVVDLTNVPVETCIALDSQRPPSESVGEKVIREKHQRFIKGQRLPEEWEPAGKVEALKVEPYEPDKDKPWAMIVDIDGTLALMNGRSPYDYTRVGEDLLNTPVADIADKWWESTEDGKIILVSGRPESCREATEAWLHRHHIPYHRLYMRSNEEHRTQVRDDKVKLRLFNEHIRDHYDVHSVLDDRDRVVSMWRQLGLTCLQVAEGRF